MATYDKKRIEELIDGTLEFYQVKEMMSNFKDKDRFDLYLSVLEERVPWNDPILLPYGLHLYIVQKKNGDRVVKCDCGHEFGDYRDNWKMSAKVFVRDTEELMNEIYPKLMAPDPEWQVIREYYCPSCATQLETEAVPPWYPIQLDFEPDIDTFYKEWLKKPLPTA